MIALKAAEEAGMRTRLFGGEVLVRAAAVHAQSARPHRG